MYIAIPLTIAAFAAELNGSLLLLNLLFLIPFFFLRKDYVHLVLCASIAVLSFFYFSSKLVTLPEDSSDVSFVWQEQVKIDGGKVKGFARLSDDTVVYMMYPLESSRQKEVFQSINLATYQFTAEVVQKELEPAAHDYAFDMKRYLRMNGAAGVLEVTDIHAYKPLTTIRSRLSHYRSNIKGHIQQQFPESLVTEAEALLIGDRSSMDLALQAEYRTLGITHLFAISGLHVGLLTFFIRALLLRIGFRKEWVTYCLLSFLPLYACIAGGAPSVWRAVTVTMILLLAVSGNLRLRLDDALAMSALLFILTQPHIVFQPGFQLSYLAAFSLLYSSAILRNASNSLHVSFLVTVITQVALYPVLLYHFFELSISSFLANLFYVPLYSVIILPANILLLACSYIMPPVASILFSIYEPIRQWIGTMTSWLASLPYQMWTPGQPDGWGAVFAVIGILLFLVCLERKKFIGLGVICLLIPAVYLEYKPTLHRDVIVSYLDVGQGDSTIIELPFRKAVYVIDTGGVVHFGEKNWKTPDRSFEVGRNIVVPYLKAKGITTIDRLLITHADADHMEGADEVLEEVRVKEIHMPPGSEVEKSMEDVLRLARLQKIPLALVGEGLHWSQAGYQFQYVAPEEGRYEGNDSSLVLIMTNGKVSCIFPGDLEMDGERRIINRYQNTDFGRVILKAGHHGSKTSSTEPFVRLIKPELAIISAGRNSRYGHPHVEVTERFDFHGIPYLSTAESGTIELRLNEDAYVISSSR
ncbi:DNA internalization-related competence protein ComEC/Rec2 [Sporosarcina sp. PTS2304]|uniref:DNA internalization-related competence protein ComEC/Rec2 n=1 Tax=Sporosarcina sp. PTS2304 TaxID=2283194 RepID=UPI000E0DBF17|nr:DNA internalization-related competence protein ComEC/Rec2 [Sporosarcina sp. PTS2304]AXH98954.1 DNA internalization-related competence protein ComEC/Rec2 [Sporosarcina sp. PTS2304]